MSNFNPPSGVYQYKIINICSILAYRITEFLNFHRLIDDAMYNKSAPNLTAQTAVISVTGRISQKGLKSKSFRFLGHEMFVTGVEHYHCIGKAAADRWYINAVNVIK